MLGSWQGVNRRKKVENPYSRGSVNHYKVLTILWLNLGVPWHWHHHAETAKI